MTTTTETPRYLGRCQCGYALSATPEDAQVVTRYGEMNDTSVPYRMGAQYYVRCPERHKPFKLFRVEGTYSEDFQCDSRCENAKGHICKCSCGGLNHGIAYAVQPTQVENLGAAVANANEKYGVTGVEVGGASYSNEELRSRPTKAEMDAREDDEYAEHVRDREKTRRPEKVFLVGEEGEEVFVTGKLIAKKDTANSTLYTFVVKVGDDEAIVKSFVPAFAIPDPDPEVRDMVEFRAIIKEHQDHPEYGKSTLVNYLKVQEINS